MDSDGKTLNGRYDLEHFQRAWRHCHLTSNYFACLGAKDRTDTSSYQLCSTIINELLELIYNYSNAVDNFELALRTVNGCFELNLTLPADDPIGEICREFESRLDQGSPSELFLSEVRRENPHAMLGLLQMVNDFGVQLDLRHEDRLQLILRFSGTR